LLESFLVEILHCYELIVWFLEVCAAMLKLLKCSKFVEFCKFAVFAQPSTRLSYLIRLWVRIVCSSVLINTAKSQSLVAVNQAIETIRYGVDDVRRPNSERPSRSLHYRQAIGRLHLACDAGAFRRYSPRNTNIDTNSNEQQEKVIAKSVRLSRLQNERDILVRFQHRTPFIRPLVEEIDECEESKTPPTLILRYLDDDALQASIKQRLTRPEVKYVARGVLEALCALHEEGFVHTGRLTYLCFCPAEGAKELCTDIKPSNILLNYSQSDRRFSDVQLADFGSTVHVASVHAQQGDPIGTAIFRSPEAQMEMKWSTATDTWSSGTMVRVSPGYALTELQQAE
jgi:hypothetical protein